MFIKAENGRQEVQSGCRIQAQPVFWMMSKKPFLDEKEELVGLNLQLLEEQQILKSMVAECKICCERRIAVAISCGHTLCEMNEFSHFFLLSEIRDFGYLKKSVIKTRNSCFQKVYKKESKNCPFCTQKFMGVQHLYL